MNPTLGARSLALLAVVLLCPPVLAQTGDSPPDTAVVPIEGVSVTGSRVPESVLRTPAALSLVPRERFESTRQISLADGLAGVPGVFTQSRGGAQDVRITIRGYGARGSGERSNAGNMRGIRVLTDGVPLTEPDGRTSLEFVDIGGTDRIEALRSNGSVLYGNASGGVLHLRTDLDFDSPFAELDGRAGSFGFHREQARVGYLLGDARGITSAYVSNFDGWRTHSGSSTTSIQNRLSAPLGDATRIGLLADFVSNFNLYPGALTRTQLAADPEQSNTNFLNRNERRFNRVGRAGLTIDHHLTESQTLSIASWVEPKVLQRSERNAFRDFNRYHVGGHAIWRIETVPNDAWKLNWTAGADEQYQDGAIQFYRLLSGSGGARSDTLFQNKREGANSAGGFVQGELLLGDAWAMRLAARYDNLWYISEDRINPRNNATKHFTQVTPKGAIAYHLPRHTLYASVGGGVEAPAFNEIDPPPQFTSTSFNPLLEPMRSTSYEVGAKGHAVQDGTWLGSLQYDAALYWIDVTNDIVPWNGGAYFFTAGQSRRRGAELGLEWAPVSALTIAGAVTASSNEYEHYVNDLGNFSGNEVAGLPDVFVDGSVRWRILDGLSVSGSVRHVGGYFADDGNVASVSSFGIVGAGVDYRYPTPFGALRAFVVGDNLLDKDYVASVFINGVSNQFFEPGLPRNVSAGIGITLR